MGVREFANVLGVEPVSNAIVLMIDGLGWEQLQLYADVAPFMSSATERRPLTAVFPATTASSLASLGTGLPPGEHGVVGYTFALPGMDRPLNALLWEPYGVGTKADLRERFVPEAMQPRPTLLERAARAGVSVTKLGPPEHAESGFTRAVLRGGRFVAASEPRDLARAVADDLAGSARSFAYAYQGDLDVAGHTQGVGSEAWLAQLARMDDIARLVAGALPPDSVLVVTGDHGMVPLRDEDKLDLADEPALSWGVRFLGGEARARHVYTEAGAEDEVLAAWRDRFRDLMWVVSREEAIAEGWFGPRITDAVLARVGDVVAVARGAVGVVQRAVDPIQAGLVAHHGSVTPAEQLVPMLVFRS
jgi:hypothetical protein